MFNNKVLYSQTSKKEETLMDAALNSLDDAEIDLQYLYENLNQVGCLTSEDIYNFL